MTPRVKIVKRIEDDIESRKPVHVEFAVLDVGMVSLNPRARLKLLRNFLCDLTAYPSVRQFRKRSI
jgi:hypothetical protein